MELPFDWVAARNGTSHFARPLLPNSRFSFTAICGKALGMTTRKGSGRRCKACEKGVARLIEAQKS